MCVMKIILSLFILLLLPFKSVLAEDCGFTSGQPYLVATTSLGRIVVQRDSPVGTVLLSTTALVSGPYHDMYVCYNVSAQFSEFTGIYSVLSPIGNNVYQTNIRGIGIRITDTRRNRIVPNTVTFDPNTSWAMPTEYKIEVIKTTSGGVDAGALLLGPLVYLHIESSSTSLNAYELDLVGDNVIVPVACSVTTSSLSFPIGDVLSTRFGSAVGTVPAGAENTQNLGLDCDPEANVNVQLNGQQNPDVPGDPSVLALTGQGETGVAQGVGVQLLYNGALLNLNQRLFLKTASGGPESFPIKARYYQTKDTVIPGSANATATLTLSYQ